MITDVTQLATALSDLASDVTAYAAKQDAEIASLTSQLAAVPPAVDLQPALDAIAQIRALLPQ